MIERVVVVATGARGAAEDDRATGCVGVQAADLGVTD